MSSRQSRDNERLNSIFIIVFHFLYFDLLLNNIWFACAYVCVCISHTHIGFRFRSIVYPASSFSRAQPSSISKLMVWFSLNNIIVYYLNVTVSCMVNWLIFITYQLVYNFVYGLFKNEMNEKQFIDPHSISTPSHSQGEIGCMISAYRRKKR